MYKLLLLFFISLIFCTQNIQQNIQPEEEEETNKIPEIEIEEINKDSIILYDSLFFNKKDYLFSARIDNHSYDSTFTLKDQNIYKVICQYQEIDNNYILALFLYKDNTSDIIYNDFPESYDLVIEINSLKFSFSKKGIFRIKIE